MSIVTVGRLACLTIAVGAAGASGWTGTAPSAGAHPAVAVAPDSIVANACADYAARGHPFHMLDSLTVAFAMANGYYHYCIPEYHDDQRFSVGASGNPSTYGPLAHVLASPHLGDFAEHSGFDGRWVNVAIVDIDDPVARMPAPYVRLGLRGRHSCVYLRHEHPASGPMYLGLVVSPVPGKCPTNPASGKALPVHEEPAVADLNENPAVARFVETDANGVAVGVRCASSWCNVGTRQAPPSAHASQAALTATSRGVVKGWFDDQVLGVPEPTARHMMRRSARASVIPDPRLGTYTIAEFLADSQRVARVYFPAFVPRKYAAAGYGHGVTTVWLRAREVPGDAGGRDTVWAARLENGGHWSNPLHAVRTDHSTVPGLVIPGTARWRWDADDEELWVACSVGCCRIENT